VDCRGPVLIDVDSGARFLKETVNSIRPRASKIYPGIFRAYVYNLSFTIRSFNLSDSKFAGGEFDVAKKLIQSFISPQNAIAKKNRIKTRLN